MRERTREAATPALRTCRLAMIGRTSSTPGMVPARRALLTIEAAPGEKPILHGGRQVKGWEKDGEKFWAAKLPGVKERTWDFRVLVVGGCPRYGCSAIQPW